MPKKYTKCAICLNSFVGHRFMQHLNYPKNAKCNAAWRKLLDELSPISVESSSPDEPIAKRHKASLGIQQEPPAQRKLQFCQPTTEHPCTIDEAPSTVDEEMADESTGLAYDDNDTVASLTDVLNNVQAEEAVTPPNPAPNVPNLPQNPVAPPPQQQHFPNEVPQQASGAKIRSEFDEFVEDSVKNRSWLDTDSQAGIELLHILHKNGAISLYDELFSWHFAYIKAKKKKPKDELMKKLRKRYDMVACEPKIMRCTLPSSGVKARIPCQDAGAMLKDLLSDPRILPEDYLWFHGNPLGAPPANWDVLVDINDGLAYRRTYEAKILPKPYTDCGRRRVLLPIIPYMDGCVTGGNENLTIEFFKITLGIFNTKARDKDYTWRNIGTVPQFHKTKAKAATLIEQSGHCDADDYLSMSESDSEEIPNVGRFSREFDYVDYIDSSDDEEDMCAVQVPQSNAQDLHVILKVILSGLKKICDDGGFEWDHYHNGERIRLFYVPFMLFIKGDTVEHDKMTGHYGSRSNGVKMLCRYCTCPNEETDAPYADFPRKSKEMMVNLVRKKDTEALKALSQHYIMNVFYEFDFGSHNNLGVHGACAMEALHWIQLGMFKYDRDMFFEQVGQDTNLAKTINTIAAKMGYLFKRQSDRGYPRTKFSKGLQRGKLHAHEMSGLILVLVATLRSTQGRLAILAGNNHYFPNEDAVHHWIMMLELQLQFESWLKLPKMDVNAVIRLRTKVRELMQLTKIVGNRQKGMGLKTNNFHATKHVPDDILLFGPSQNVNSRSNEMHHKKDKKSSKCTQKRPDCFDLQTTQKVEDRRVIEMGMEELKGRPKWDYFEGFERADQIKAERFVNPPSPKKRPDSPNPTGVKATFAYDLEKDAYAYKVISTMKRKSRFRYPQHIVDSIADLTEELVEYGATQLTVYAEVDMPNGQKYRASPFYQGKPWYDWASCRLGEPNGEFPQRILPVHLRCFVDLRFLPADNTTKYAPGLYFIGEPTKKNPNLEESHRSDLLQPYLKEAPVVGFSPNKLVILPVSRIIGPTCVIPDVGDATKRAFLQVKPVEDWAKLFAHWINSPLLQQHEEPEIGE